MNLKTYLKLNLAAIFLFFSISCSEDDAERDCISSEVAFVEEVDAPETAEINEVVTINVSFWMRNTCGSFNSFQETYTEDGLIIEVYADYIGCICGQAIIEDTQVYEFTPTAPGQVELKFRAGNDEFISLNIEVAE